MCYSVTGFMREIVHPWCDPLVSDQSTTYIHSCNTISTHFFMRQINKRGFYIMGRDNNIFMFVWWYCSIVSSSFLDISHARPWMDGRHSYSLTTFDTEGRLRQVDRALEAASLGTPILAVVMEEKDSLPLHPQNNNKNNKNNKKSEYGILMVSPQRLPSMLMDDDGTSRFAAITSELMVAHSGLSADGRVIVAAAQRLAVQHEYVFDEEIPIDIFLQELSLLFQEYTMKPAARPFGVILLVAHVPQQQQTKPQLFRVDPSGSVSGLGRFALLNGNALDTPVLRQSLLDVTKATTTTATTKENNAEENSHSSTIQQNGKAATTTTTTNDLMQQQQTKIVSILQDALRRQAKQQGDHYLEEEEDNGRRTAIVSAALSRTRGFSVQRHEHVPLTPLMSSSSSSES